MRNAREVQTAPALRRKTNDLHGPFFRILLVAAVGVGLRVGLAFQRRHASKPRGPFSE